MYRQLYILLILILLSLAGCQNGPEQPELAVSTVAVQAVDSEAGTAVPNTVPTATPLPEPTVTPSPIPPTATPLPTKVLTICVNQLPDNLYIYGDRSNNAQMIQQAIYEPLMTTFGYSYQPLALAELPDLTAG
ncbi:MAG: hypothetical protein AAF490_33160, partial [Chloroflexota bacterium]